MRSPDYAALKQEIESCVRAHRIGAALKLIRRLKIKDVPEPFRGEFSQLARRCNDIPRAIKLLYPNIYKKKNPTAKDLIEYASTIRKAGMIKQCRLLLDRVPPCADVHLHRAYCFTHEWDYPAAQTELEKYLSHQGVGEYQRWVATTNLISSMVANGHTESALIMLTDLKTEIGEQSRTLYLNLCEIQGQAYFQIGDYESCLAILEELEKTYRDESSTSMLFVNKWKTLCQGKIQPNEEDARVFRTKARSMGHFESLRHFDLVWAQLTNNENLLKYAYFGSPMQAFRAKFPAEAKTFGSMLWAGAGFAAGGPTVDPIDLSARDIPFALNLHRTTLILLSDFYQPWSLYRIHDALFFDEIFDPEETPKKIYQQLSRLGKLLSEDSPLTLSTSPFGYRLRPSKECATWVHPKMIFGSSAELIGQVLRARAPSAIFHSKDLKNLVPIKASQAPKHLQQLEELGTVEKIGRTQFRIKQAG